MRVACVRVLCVVCFISLPFHSVRTHDTLFRSEKSFTRASDFVRAKHLDVIGKNNQKRAIYDADARSDHWEEARVRPSCGEAD